MSILKSKQTREIEKKMLVKKTINAMNKQITKLEEQKKVFIQAAKNAKQKGLEAQVNLAMTGLKMTMSQQKRAQEMLLNFEITSQMKDMSMMTTEFLGGMSVLSKEMAKLTNSKEFIKVQKQFEVAMAGVENQTEQMELFMDGSQSAFSAQAGDSNNVSDSEINSLVDEQASQDTIEDDQIDKELAEIRKKLSE